MKLDLVTGLYVFMLAAFIGFEVIRRVSPLLHTPLMSLTNALDAIAVVGAIILVGEGKVQINLEDEIIRETLLTRDGEIVNKRVREFFKLPALAAAE